MTTNNKCRKEWLVNVWQLRTHTHTTKWILDLNFQFVYNVHHNFSQTLEACSVACHAQFALLRSLLFFEHNQHFTMREHPFLFCPWSISSGGSRAK